MTHLNLVVVGQHAHSGPETAEPNPERRDARISRLSVSHIPTTRATTVGLAVILRYLKHQPAYRIQSAKGPRA